MENSNYEKPNLLFVFTDEQATSTMKAYGNNMIHTPNMDKLASESIVFKNAYITQPVCTPSRASLMTGLYPHSNGCTENNLLLRSDVPCLPELGDFTGYKTAYYGKWHLGDEVFPQHGFDCWRSTEDNYRKYFSDGRDMKRHSSYYNFLVNNGFKPNLTLQDGFDYFHRDFCTQLPEEFSKPAYLAQEAGEFIKKNKDNPFILYVNFIEPHMPYHSPRDDQYNAEEISLPVNFSHNLDSNNPLKTLLFKKGYYERGHSGLQLKTEDDWKKMIANYWGLVSLVDTYLGKILNTLDECGLSNDTIVVYTSDHGDMMGSHRLLAKCVMFEEAVKVPLLLKIPHLESKIKEVDVPVSQVDLIPTVLEAMNQNTEHRLDGCSWIPFLKGKQPLTEENVFIEWNSLNSGFGDVVGGTKIPDCWKEMADENEIKSALSDPIRTIITPDRWKYNCSQRGEDELYNLDIDPFETKNLAKQPEYKALIKDLQSKIKCWQLKTCDSVVINNF